MWKQVENSNYEVSLEGLIRNIKTKQVIKPRLDKDGYEIITLWSTFLGKTKKVHRIVATAFLSNPDNKPQVNHKDSNRRNNHRDNLEWATAKENIDHGIEFGKICLRRLREVKAEYMKTDKAKEVGRALGLKYKYQNLNQYKSG